ncbi:MAG TPA: hypothetical protein VNT30_09375 [Stellaceae bacterium]|nr:hypothetical protein [Stellaceae bacterium]
MFAFFRQPCFAPDAGGSPGAASSAASADAGATAPTTTAPAPGATVPAATVPATAAPAVTSFSETLPEDIRGDAVFKDIKDLAGLAKSYRNAAKMVGLDKATVVALPSPEDAEGWNGLYGKLGRPESADKYVMPAKGEGLAYDETDAAFQKTILPILHEAGITQRQLDAIIPKWNTLASSGTAAKDAETAAQLASASATLKTDWGQAYEPKLALANDAIRHYADELKLGGDVTAALESTGLGNHPALAKLFAHLGAQLQEDGALKGRGSGGGAAVLSPAEGRQQIAAKQNDAEFMKAYTSKSAPGHADAVQAMQRLYEMAFPSAT